MIRLVLIALLCSVGTAGADGIYRWENKDGSVTYSDQPPPASADGGKLEPEELPPLQVVPAIELPAEPAPAAESTNDISDSYEQFSITQPHANTAVRANDGNVAIAVDLKPALRTSAGHRIHVYLDGSQAAQGEQSSFSLSSLDRGVHTAHAEVRDKGGNILASTGAVSFTVLRHSNLF